METRRHAPVAAYLCQLRVLALVLMPLMRMDVSTRLYLLPVPLRHAASHPFPDQLQNLHRQGLGESCAGLHNA
jgi:hypothetical protein